MKNAPSKWARRQPSFKVMEVLKRARELEHEGRRVILATPSNPTGALIQTAQLEAINDFVVGRQGFVMVDEIYQGLVYEPDMDEVATTSLAIDSELIVVNSFSKYFGMTEWRLGWCVVPDLLIEALERA
ncbi:MAG TPA: aminotransferase class I/II-fold pyridoxal phosphate-dependent enzyme, partial [Gammaproteobacteria bacterium]|nr:aminotransferase class I/II-fold pyridoxal phosphate-dependent enzyme [Gammaproteobacteria bacterium]